jgi:DNA-binding transcriptional regulator YhcF (GntR family)
MVESVSSSFNELANSINDGIEHWKTIDEAYKELNETGLVTTETIAKIAEEFADFDGIDDVVESLLNGTMSLQEFNEVSDE